MSDRDRAKGGWIYRRSWANRWPSIGSADGPVHTLVLPWPIPYRKPTEDDPWVFSALIVALPWWPCRCMEDL